MRAASDDPVDRDKALAEICTLYWPPVYAFIRSRGYPPHDAEDLTQGVFAKLLARHDFAKVDAAFGKLRTYLLTTAKNHLASAYRKESRLKRGGDTVMLSIDAADAEARCLIPEPLDSLSPDRVFDRQWAVTVMEYVVNNLAARYAKKNNAALFEALKPFILSSSSPEPQSDLAVRLGMSESALRIAVHRLRQRYAECLRRVVKSTLVNDENVEDEIAHLISSFS